MCLGRLRIFIWFVYVISKKVSGFFLNERNVRFLVIYLRKSI